LVAIRPSGAARPAYTYVHLVILLSLIALALVLRSYNLSVQSIWSDEAASLDQADGTLAQLFAMTAGDNYPPLHNLILFASINILGNNEIGGRLPSVILGIADIAMVYLFAAVAGYRRAGLIAAAFLAVSTLHIQYSQETRMYALLAFATTATALSSLRFVERQTWQRAVLTVLSAAALLYTHPFGMLNFGAIGLGTVAAMLVWQRDRWRVILGYIGLGFAAIICFVPWGLITLQRAQAIGSGGFWIPDPTVDGLLRMNYQLFGGQLGLVLVILGLLCLVSTLVIPALRERGDAWRDPDARLPLGVPLTILVAIGFLPFIAALVVSLNLQSMMLARYLIGSIAPVVLLAVIGADRLSARLPVVASLLAMVLLLGAVNISNVRYVRDDWRGVANELRASFDPEQDCLVVQPWWAQRALTYYYKELPPCYFALRDGMEDHLVEIGGRPVSMVIYAALGVDATTAALEQAGYQRASDQAYVNARVVRFNPPAPAVTEPALATPAVAPPFVEPAPAVVAAVATPPVAPEIVPASAAPVTMAVAAPAAVPGATPSGRTIRLSVWGQDYLHEPRFEVRADGALIGSGEASADTANTATTFEFAIPDGADPEVITIALVNDKYGGAPESDVNLFIGSIEIGGRPLELASLPLGSSGYVIYASLGYIIVATNPYPLEIQRSENW